ncbi:2-(1,2-epoxy-1,2-dihydrophenyl)acetyl-CoA isomerase [Actinomadura coerulea]|uniref:2-(1,2-epoxy-1,2-dihydrophenyl)acetyl-CoA isomerase n=1 Tax=Actinomadura coerulea TaxID=46159 RepID=A0A7X0G8N8_9ACTN|nr:enoyl-CoA hydratase-related protein [Actinomadura coerulea]MBB6400346.1 2-(1,2-epoxy-1,2-dihydrophenyl)acetyl-CoA isomerase [Actinomadura coerulea]GGQ39959.1 enoyl-CoA hydratase [Actinomadura coerulea]
MSETVLYDVTDAVGTITLNRPDGMNSLTVEMKEALRAAVVRAAADPAVRAVVLTGAGRAFCAGQDLREHGDNLAAGRGLDDTVRKHYNPIVLAIAGMRKPVVAAVNGVAAGAGASLAFACDLIVASDKARFATAFTGIGLAPDSGMSWTLQRLVGRAKAAELLLLGEPVKAPEALELGLVTRVVPADELAPASMELARRLASGPTASYGAVKAALDHAATHDLASALEREAELQDECEKTSDHHNATEAFLKKRQPVFEGR